MATVTTGYTFTGTTDPITYSKLNLLGQPTVTLGTNEVTLANLPAAAANNTFLARSTSGAGNYEALVTTTTGLGFYTGAGGTVTQATSKATAFSLSKMCGQITTAGDVLNAATIVSSTWTNTLIAATDVVIINHKSGGTLGAYTINVACLAGSATLTIRNNTAGNLTETLVLNFVVIKGVTS
jgi:hypothetical protein